MMIQIMHEHSYNLNPLQEWLSQEMSPYVQLELEEDASNETWPAKGDFCYDVTDVSHEIDNDNNRIQEEHSYNLNSINGMLKNNDEPSLEVSMEDTEIEDEVDHISIEDNSLVSDQYFSSEDVQQIQQEHLYNLNPQNYKLVKNGELELSKSKTLREEYESFTCENLTDEMQDDFVQHLIQETDFETNEEDSDMADVDLSTFVRICQLEEKALREIDECFSLSEDLEHMKD